MFILFKGAIPLVKSDERICWDVSKFMNVHPNLVPVAMDCASPQTMCSPALVLTPPSLKTVMYVTSV
jgi:hypothetical protein